jgi:molecular chaperone HtpG
MMEDLAKDKPEQFATFWKAFGRVVKEGIPEDPANQDKIAKVLRFASTKSDTEEQTVSLADYVGRMREGQDAIYYVTADGFQAAKNSPHLEIFRKLGVEVLLMYDRIDEWVVSALTQFEGKSLKSVAKGDLNLDKLGGEEAKKGQEAQAGEFAPLVERIQHALKDRTSAVRVTHRLTDSPACLVSEEHGMSTNLERMLKAAGQDVPTSKPVLEVNPQHPVVKRLKDETDIAKFADWSHILFDQATLAEGGQLEDPAGFVKRLNDLLLAMAGAGPSRIWTPGS